MDKSQRRGTDKFDMLSPSWQIDYYLRISEVPWGILTDGRFWRLYSHDTSFRLDVYYEIDLPQLIAQRDTEAFKYFYLFFRREAFTRDAEGLCFLDRVYQGSLEYARAVGDDLKEDVYKALRVLAEGFLNTPGNDLNPQLDIEVIHENSLVYLYRLLFINYAEDRGLLPRENRLYKETYGLVAMEREIASKTERQQSLSPLQATYWEKLRALFDLVNGGSEAFRIDKDTLFVPPYNGGLFEPERHGFLEKNKVADRWLAQVIDLLARSKGEGAGRAFVDYSSLDVRHLGSIYEGLLEYKLRVAQEERVAVKRRRREEWVPADEAEGKRIVERVKAGGLYLATDRGQRKATGSYYTPDYIVKYIVENTVGPLIAEKMKEDDPIEGILSLKVLDPAMGSGHFLVEATDRLAHALVEALGGSDEEREEEDVRWARREVVERCIYGVDLNPLAVELAKLSLWLHTVAEGKPLNFLDHHLKVGNSLIGAWVEDLGSLPVRRKRGKAKEPEQAARQMNLFETRLDERLPTMLNRVLEIIRRGSETLEDIKAKVAADEAVEKLKAPFKAVADLWVSKYFGNEVAEAEYQEALEHIGEPDQLLSLPAIERGRQIGEDKRFFHWELEFPEVFYEDSKRRENPGFDAYFGNPPYVNIYQIARDEAERDFYKASFSTAYSKFDLYVLFIELGTQLLRRPGQFGFICPGNFLTVPYGERLREHLLHNATLHEIVDLMRFSIFEQAANTPILLLFENGGPTPEMEPHAFAVVHPKEDPSKQRAIAGPVHRVEQKRYLAVPGYVISLELSEIGDQITNTMEARSLRLEDLHYVHRGLTFGAEYWHHHEDLLARQANLKRFVKGKDISRYSVQYGGRLIAYQKAFYTAPFKESLFETPKMLFPKISALAAAWDLEGYYTDSTAILSIPYYNAVEYRSFDPQGLERSKLYDPLYVLTLVNSALMFYFFRYRSQASNVVPQLINQLPIRQVSFSTRPTRRRELAQQGEELTESCFPDLVLEEDRGAYVDFTGSRLGQWLCLHLEAHPEQSDVVHDLLAYLAEQMIEMNKAQHAEAKGFLDWLVTYTRLPVEEWRLKTIVRAYWEHPWEQMQRALRQNRKAIEKASGRNVEGREAVEAIETEFEKSVACLEPLMERIASTDRLIDLIVYRLYGLTDQEVAIVEESATR